MVLIYCFMERDFFYCITVVNHYGEPLKLTITEESYANIKSINK